jgi:hypothetical protein
MTSTNPRSDTQGAGPHGPALTGTHDEILLQALRNLWPILGTAGRAEATKTANSIKERQ